MTEESDSRLEELCQKVGTLTGSEEAVDPDASLEELGVDSINVVELIMIAEQLYPNISDPDSLAFDQQTTPREMDQQMRDNEMA